MVARAPVALVIALVCGGVSSLAPPTRGRGDTARRGGVRVAALPPDEDVDLPFERLDALGERLRSRRAANDFLVLAENEAMITADEADAARDKIENPDPDEPPPPPKERYSRFGDWFDVLAK